MSNYFKIGLFALTTVGVFFLLQNKENKHPQPANTIVLDNEEDSEGQLKREEWIETMHRTAPGENWRSYEYATQMQRHLKRREATRYATQRSGAMSDTIADGALIGTWQERGSNNQAGSVFDVEYDAAADKLWLISAGGTLWRGNRDGSLWEVVNQDLRFSTGTLRFITTDIGRRLIANIGDLPHYSDDDGLTWTAATGITISDGWGKTYQTQFIGEDQKIYTLSKPDYWSNYRIYASQDKGGTYTETNAYFAADGGERQVALCNPYGSDSLYYLRKVSTGIQMWQINTTDDTAELLHSSTDFMAGNAINLSGTVVDDSVIFYSYDENNRVYKSIDFGENWIQQGQIPIEPWSVGMFLSPSFPEVLFTGGVNAYRSLDGGQTWDLVNEWWEYYDDVEGKLHADMMAFSEFKTSSGQVFNLSSNHGGLNISYDYLSSNTNIGMDGLNVSQYYSVKSSPADPSYIFAGSQDQGMQRGQDDGSGEPIDLEQIISGDYGHIVFTNEGDNFWTVYPGGWLTYYNNAYTGGIAAEFTIESDNESVWIPPIHPTGKSDENAVYMAGGNISGGSGSYLIKAEYVGNGALSPSQFSYDFMEFTNGEVSAIEVSDIDPNYIYTATTNGRFFYSQDGGDTWEQNVNFLNSGHYLYGQSIFASRLDANTVYLAGSGYSNPAVYRSTDGGEFFADFSTGLPSTLVFEITANSDETMLFAATEAGPYVYIFEEESWFDMSGMCAPAQTYWSVEYIESIQTVRFGTYGRGIWDFAIDTETISATAEANKIETFKIYPNPASDYFSLENGILKGDLTISDLQGKVVQILKIREGDNQISISDLARGTYILTLESEGEIRTSKLIKQ